jgi:2-phosphosulfolactate phosphatase
LTRSKKERCSYLGKSEENIQVLIDTALNPAEIALLPQRDLSATTCVVFDVLRATSSMITGLAHGAREIWPARTIEGALEIKTRIPDAVLGGERHGDRIEGFDVGNNPLEYVKLSGRRIITTTTNGTMALRACESAPRVLVGALLNLDAVKKQLFNTNHVLLVCAGTFETFALEDAIAAGLLAAMFPDANLTDSTRACISVAQSFQTPLSALLAARNGRALAERGWGDQVNWCAQVSHFSVVGVMNEGVIRPL